MAVQNNLTAAQKFSNAMIEYESNGIAVKLSPTIVRNYLVNGGGAVTDQEIVMFLNLCKAQGLNPFLREAYLIKYGNSAATIVTGKEVFTKRARRNKDYAGYEAGVITAKDNEFTYRAGAFVLPGETLVGGWAKVHIKGYSVPIEISVTLDEYIGTKTNGEVNSQWAKRPATMIRKVALVQALREAFPEDLQGMYEQDEMSIESPELNEMPIDMNAIQEQLETITEMSEAEPDPFL